MLADPAALGTVSGVGSGGRLALAGGTVSTAGGAGGAGVSVTAGSLIFAPTAPSSAVLEFGTGAHLLRFAQFENGPPLDLTVTGWQGAPRSSGLAGQIVFDNPGPLSGFLSQITFTGFDPGAILIPFSGGGFELVPVPEPAGLLLAAVVGLAVRRRRPAPAG